MELGCFVPDALIFDVDGVLLDVQNSFPEVIRVSVLEGWKKFCGGISDTPGYTHEHAKILKQHCAFNDDYDIVWFLLTMSAATDEKALSKAFPSAKRLADEVKKLSGDVVSWTRARYGDNVPRREIREMCAKHYFSEAHKLEKPMLRCHWRKLPLPVAIYTGRDGTEWEAGKITLGWEDFPDRNVINSDSGIRKPSPEGLRLLCERLGASRPAFFGDTGSDIMAARTFGQGYFIAIGNLLPEAEFIYETPEKALEELLGFKTAEEG